MPERALDELLDQAIDALLAGGQAPPDPELAPLAAIAAGLLHLPEEKFQQRPATLVKLFGLTRVEAEIALLLGQGMSLHEIATHRAVSYETARAHLKSIYRKTDTNRQSELSLLLSNIRMR